MTVACILTRSIMFDDHNLHTTSRELVDKLLDDGEQEAIKDTVAIETERDDGFSEMVCGWGVSKSLPKPPISASQRISLRRKAPKPQPPDIDTSRITVRCVSEDYKSDTHRASWKANVEPGTYRYIANNGIYRSTKFSTTHSDWVTAKRSRHSERLTTTPEVRHAQKTLRKELNEHFKNSESRKPESKPKQQSNTEQIIASTPFILKRMKDVREEKEVESRPITRKDPQLIKSTSDLFVENFSSKLTALERELTTAGNGSNTPENLAKPGTSSQSTVTAINTTKHYRRDLSPTDAARFLAQQAEDISKDVFTVKPVTRAEQPLKPLEKLTPHHKMLERQSESEKTSNASNSAPESPALSTSFMTAMNAFTQIHHQHHRDGQQCKSGPSTFRSNHKNSSGSFHNFSSNSSDTDSLNSVRNALTLTNKDIEKMRMNHIAIKDYGRYVMSNAKIGMSSTMMAKPFGGQRRGKAGYRPTATSASNTMNINGLSHSMCHGNEVKPTTPDTVSDTQPSTAPGTVGRSLRDSKANSMSLPEISGKRLPVTSTSQRML